MVGLRPRANKAQLNVWYIPSVILGHRVTSYLVLHFWCPMWGSRPCLRVARAYWADEPSSIEMHQYLRNHTSSLYTSAEEMSANISTWRCILWRFPGRPAGIDYEHSFHEHLIHFLYWIEIINGVLCIVLYCNIIGNWCHI